MVKLPAIATPLQRKPSAALLERCCLRSLRDAIRGRCKRKRLALNQKKIVYDIENVKRELWICGCDTGVVVLDCLWSCRWGGRFRLFVSLPLGWLFWAVCGSVVGCLGVHAEGNAEGKVNRARSQLPRC